MGTRPEFVYARAVAFWRRKRSAVAPQVGCFGKLPATGDFIRHNAGFDELGAWDRWLGSGIDLARRSLGSEFEPAYARSVGLFLFRPEPAKPDEEPTRALLGAWAASGDNAGRVYPMSVFAAYDYSVLAGLGGAAPVVLWQLVTQLYELATAGRSLSVDAFLERVNRIQAPTFDDPEAVLGSYREWLSAHRMHELWGTGFGTDESRFWVLQNLFASVEPFRSTEFPRTGLCVRLPLGAGDAFSLAVWLDATLRLGRWQRTMVNALWVPQRTALLHLGTPHAGSFRELLAPTGNAEHVADLCGPPGIDEATSRRRLGPALDSLVARTDLTIAQFLDGLGRA